MDWQILRNYFKVKHAQSTRNKGELYSKEELYNKINNARKNLNIMVNFLVNETNLVQSIQSSLQLAYVSQDFNKKKNNYVMVPCDFKNVQSYYNEMLISDDVKDKLSFEKLENSYQKYVQYQFAVYLSKAFHQKGYKTAIDNLNLQGMTVTHYPIVKIFL